MNSSLGCVLFESLLVFHNLILPLLLLLHLLPLFHLVLCHEISAAQNHNFHFFQFFHILLPLSFSFFICVQDFALEKTIKYTMENEPARSLAFVQGLLLF